MPLHFSSHASALAAALLIAPLPISLQAATTFVDFVQLDPTTTRLVTTEDTTSYYILEKSLDALGYQALDLAFGIDSPVWDIDFAANSATRSFYRVHAESVFAPLDTDNDGIDDVYELNHPDILDPLDPDDADLDPDDDGSTHLQDYLRTILDTDSPPQYYSRELTTFNLGASLFPTADAISRELTTFNFGVATAGTEALSRELAIYNGSGPPTVAYMPRVVSRQTSVFNFPVSTAAVEALSRQLTLYNGSGLPTVSYMKVVTSREVTAFNYPTQTARIEAISREVSVNALMSQD
ncbi:MAG: hypothetical protein P8J87_17465 [Verrucomicrobiales bacterium]|nr:hypothetical protein [Verrucomicrobiales bacterium]